MKSSRKMPPGGKRRNMCAGGQGALLALHARRMAGWTAGATFPCTILFERYFLYNKKLLGAFGSKPRNSSVMQFISAVFQTQSTISVFMLEYTFSSAGVCRWI